MDRSAFKRMHPVRPRLHARQQSGQALVRDHVLVRAERAAAVLAVHHRQPAFAHRRPALPGAATHNRAQIERVRKQRRHRSEQHRRLSAVGDDLRQLSEAARLLKRGGDEGQASQGYARRPTLISPVLNNIYINIYIYK